MLGREGSLGGFLQNHLLEREVRDRALQPGMLPFACFQPLGWRDVEPTVLVAPSGVRVFGEPQCAAALSDGLSLAQRHLSFTQCGEDLFDGVTKPWQNALRSARPSQRIWTRLRGAGQRLEVANVIAKAEATTLVTEARSAAFLEMLEGIDIEVDAATSAHALSDTLQLARRYRLSAYDASYLELALRLGIPLATLDEDLQKDAKKARVKKFA